jgi:endonuclease/exonuclease/phosphatase family metal-dependent hydrolase
MKLRTLFLAVIFLVISNLNNSFAQTQKIMSFNIRIDVPNDGINNWHHRKEGLTQLVKYYNPGIIAFQEVFGGQRVYIDSVLTNYNSIGMGRDGNFHSEALPIFYDSLRYNLLQHGTFWLSETGDTASLGWNAAYPRICTYGKFKTLESGKKLWVFNIHLDNNGDTAKYEGAKMVVSKIKELTNKNEAVMVMGDLNSTPESNPVKVFKDHMKYGADISEKGLYGPNGTYNDFKNNIIFDYWIDYIFTQNIKVKSYAHIDDKLPNNNCVSDHIPVLMEYCLP